MIESMGVSARAAVWTMTIAAGVSTIILSAEGPQRATADDRTAASSQRYSPPRTAWGDPDLQGMWPSDQLVEVPFERPAAFGTRTELTDAEFAAAQARATSDISPVTAPPPHWLERGKASRQASLVVDPPDGRLPSMTEDGARRAEQWRTTSAETYLYRGPEDLTPYDRCISRGVLGSVFPNIYGTGTHILQTPGFVIIRYEMIHETRIVPLDGRAHLSSSIRSYMGDTRGRWDGDSLVVETTNYLNGFQGSTPDVKLTERYTRVSPDFINWEVTVDDPKTWTKPWTFMVRLKKTDGLIYEYACHEGNYSMTGILAGARAEEAKAAGKNGRR
jgi:hypothetical protein